MASPLRFLGVVVLLGGIAAGVLAWQHRATSALRDELGRKQRAALEEKWLKAEHAGMVAKQVAPEELARRREERAAWVALAAEINTLRERVETKKTASPPAPPNQPQSMKNLPLAAAEWRDAGQETPAAAFETALWAAAGGKVDKLAAGLEIDEATKAAAAEVFNRLPAALQREIATPEQLVALLTARDVPLGSAWILGQFDEGAQQSKVVAQLADAEGQKRELTFSLREREGRWRLVVPPQVMTKYTAFLQGKPVEPAR